MSYRYANAKYMTIAEQIVERFRAGEFQSDRPFYSRDELAKTYHIAQGTATSVLKILEDRNIISCRKGKRAVLASPLTLDPIPEPCKPVFYRPAATAETPEYDFIAYCARNLARRERSELAERSSEELNSASRRKPGAKDVAVVFPSPERRLDVSKGESSPASEPQDKAHPSARIDLVFDRVCADAVTVFSRKACMDCLLHLIQHGLFTLVYVTSPRTVFPWYAHLAEPGAMAEYAPGANVRRIEFKDDLELFPAFLRERILAELAGHSTCAAILMDDPYLSDYLSGELRAGMIHVPPGCFFFGTVLCERSMVFPYLDLKLDRLAASILRMAFLKSLHPAMNYPCDFHVVEFKTTEHVKF